MRLLLRVGIRTWDLVAIAIDLQFCEVTERFILGHTINFDLVFRSEYSLFAIMHSSRGVNEINDIRMITVGGEEESK